MAGQAGAVLADAAAAVPLLSVEELSVDFRTREGTVRALERVGFTVGRGETVGIVGESGSGKSVTAYALMGILDEAGQVTHGSAMFGGLNLLAAPERDLQRIRGRELSMIFQSPRTALNPIRAVGKQLEDVLLRHGNLRARDARDRAIELLAQVKIPDPKRRYAAYPFELSGGMCQRIMIALALACSPALLIADEPTTGLDVTTQAVIMDLIRELAADHGMATVLITHDLGLASEYCDRIVVMHAGHVVETAPMAVLFDAPRHPYTAKLIAATPHFGGALHTLAAIGGSLPDLRGALPPCRYATRCERRIEVCDQPPLSRDWIAADHLVACANPL
ncbi:MAG TPA: ABC transporter ATP-binding protein [Stellaceae bacterium]|nr:ABC transporter ATP-binding protein [Stellaceae bacterium]